MHTIEETIEIERALSAVYDYWTRFEDFPQFMTAITEVRQVDDKHLRWKATIGGKALEWDAEIIEQVLDQRIRWCSTRGAENSGTLTFISLTPTRTRVILYLSYDPKGFSENVADNLGFVSAAVSADLNRFKEFMESRGASAPIGRAVQVPMPTRP
jgi:uncharacterized membrane protein